MLLAGCLGHSSILVKRYFDQDNSDKRKHFGGLLTVLEGSSWWEQTGVVLSSKELRD